MSRIDSTSLASDRPQGPKRKLPPGVCHVSELMPQVLSAYGLSPHECVGAEVSATATETACVLDLSIAAFESVLAS